MFDKRSLARSGGRALVGLAGMGLAALTVAAATMLPLPQIVSSPPAMTVTPQPANAGRVCPGPLLALTENTATSVSSFGSSTSTYGAFGGQGGVHARPLTPKDTEADVDQSGSAPALISLGAQPATGVAPTISGSQSQTASGEDIYGLATAECGMPSADSWLAGGSTAVGRTTLILLSNPSAVTASVDLAVYAESGVVVAPGAEGIIVEAGSQRVLPLAGLAPDVESPVIHVLSRGGQVYATLQYSVVRGLAPGGVELVGPTAPAAVRQVIAGVILTPTSKKVPNDTGAVLSDAAPAVRVFAAGDTDAAVQLSVVSEDAGGVGTAMTTTVAANTVVDVPLEGVAAGAYTVIVSSNTPVVASVRGATSGSTAVDFAWFAASKPVNGSFPVSVAKGPSPELHLYNDTQVPSEVTVTPVSGAAMSRSPQTLVIAPGAAVKLPVVSGSRYDVAGGKSLVAALSYSKDGAQSAFAITPSDALATPLTVYRG